MKPFYLILLALLTIVSGAKATEYTTVEALTDHYFVMSIDDNGTPSTYYLTGDQNLKWGDISTVTASAANYFIVKAKAVTVSEQQYYVLRFFDCNGMAYTSGIDGENAINPYWAGFFAGAWDEKVQTGVDAEEKPVYNHPYSYGSDRDNNALWQIEVGTGENAGKFAFKSCSPDAGFTDKYLGINSAKNDAAVYWTCSPASDYLTPDAAAYSSVSDIVNHHFILQGGSNAYYWSTSSGNDAEWGTASTNATGLSNYYAFKAIPMMVVNDTTYYALRVFTFEGYAIAKVDGGNGLNPYDGGFFAGAWNNGNYGSDSKKYNGLWAIAYDESIGGFSFQMKSRYASYADKYLGWSSTKKDEPVFFQCLSKTKYDSERTLSAATFTTIDQLTSNLFMLTAEESSTEYKLIFQKGQGWDVMPSGNEVNNAEAAFGGYYFKAEAVEVDTDNDDVNETHYALHIYGPDGTDTDQYELLGNYVNHSGSTGSYNGNITFAGKCSPSGTTYQYGEDVDYGGLWTITASDGKFAFENVAGKKASSDQRYLWINHKNGTSAPYYFTARNRYSNSTFYRKNTEANKFLSFSFPYDATISGAKVYTLSSVDSKSAPTESYIEPVGDGKVLAGKGYILKTTATSDVTVTVSDLSTFSKTSSENGALIATLYPTRVPQNSYVLSSNQWLIADDATEENRPKAGATRAYLDLSKAAVGMPAGARVMSFFLEDNEATAIDNSLRHQDEMKNKQIFNLNGQRVSQPAKGLYVINGKKVFIK